MVALPALRGLWNLSNGELAHGTSDARLDQDARLGPPDCSYARDWLQGAGRFAALCCRISSPTTRRASCVCSWCCDTRCAGSGGFPDGLVEIEDGELFPIHPSEDPDLTGLDIMPDEAVEARNPVGRTPGALSGRKTAKNYRQPFEYAEILKAAGVDLDVREITARYYRELALPHLIPFPVTHLPHASDPLPEGLDLWDIDTPLEQLDWFGTLLSGPDLIPGVTTRQRHYGDSPSTDPATRPFDLYLGIDCSGSMGDPASRLSYPVLAGAIIALSALRAGSRVKECCRASPASRFPRMAS